MAATTIKLALARNDQGETFSAKRDAKAGRAVVAVFGDSTGAIATRWPRRLCTALAAADTNAAVGYWMWNDTGQVQGAREAVAAGVGASVNGVVVNDTFTRTAADLRGSTSDSGHVWGGFGNAALNYTLDGARAVRGTAALAEWVTTDSALTGDRTVTLTGVSQNTVGQSVASSLRLTAGRVDLNNFLWAFLTISTTGVVGWGISKIQAGTTTTVATGGATTLPNNSATVSTFDLSVSIAGLVVTATLAGVSVTYTMSSAEAAAIASGTVDGFYGTVQNNAQGQTINAYSVSINHPATPALDLEMYNGSVSGSNLTYQATRLDLMCPEPPDLVLISSVHNYGGTLGPAYLDALDAFVNLIITKWPAAGIAVMSQNPQKPGTLNPVVAAHQARNIAIRSWCAKKGVGYIPVFEAFRKRPDLGVSYVRADGVHPTDTTDNADPNGSSLWTTTVANWLAAKLLGV